MENLQSFIKENSKEMQIITALDKATQENPGLTEKLENAQSEQEVLALLKEYIGAEYTAAEIMKASNAAKQLADLLNAGGAQDELSDETLDNIVGGISWKGFWKRVGLSFKIAGEALGVLSAANPEGDFEGRVNMATNLIDRIKKDAKAFREAK